VAGALAANINQAALVAMAPDIRRVLTTGGRAILAGFRGGELAAVELAISLPRLEVLEFQGWACLVCGG
jgi:ribosomal protein L11 methylase PrmA